jgi:type IV pilus assembly protein PilE
VGECILIKTNSKFFIKRQHTRLQGFTLIEVMIVVAVMGILTTVALPSYTEYLKRANRAAAKSVLLETALLMERNYTQANRYDLKSDGTAFTLTIIQTPQSGDAKYTIGFAAGALNQNTFTLQAVPAGIMVGDACGTYTVTNVGAKGSGGTMDDCWNR